MRITLADRYVFAGGREVCRKNTAGKREYQRRIDVMHHRQGGMCCLCHLPLDRRFATFEHEDGRGLGGGRRDDRTEKDGHWINGAAHGQCNGEKGSRRVRYNA